MTNNPRRIALNMVEDIIEKNRFSHMVIQSTLKKHQKLNKQDRAFISRLSVGTVKHYITLDFIINKYASLPVHKMKVPIRNILRISVYQMFYMDHVPVSAICNEGVKLTKDRGMRNLSGFINGILRNIARDNKGSDGKLHISNIEMPDKSDKSYYLKVKYSTPKWLVEKLLMQYNFEIVEGVLKDSLDIKKTIIRTNMNKISPNELRESLEKNGIEVKAIPYMDYGFEISGYDYLEAIEEFTKGYFTIQDSSSMLVSHVADFQEEDLVLDTCAAPGGKSYHGAEKAKKIIARDLTQRKVDLINLGIDRLGYDNIETQVWDARVKDESLVNKLDKVIVDLPCSGLGVLKNKPDIKYRLKEEQFKELIELQREILTTSAEYPKIGGNLIISTCTINKEENMENLKWFINKFDYKIEEINKYLPNILHNNDTKEGFIQILPGNHEGEGFFISRLKRKG